MGVGCLLRYLSSLGGARVLFSKRIPEIKLRIMRQGSEDAVFTQSRSHYLHIPCLINVCIPASFSATS